jgi:transcription termination/antitermination protein NusG
MIDNYTYDDGTSYYIISTQGLGARGLNKVQDVLDMIGHPGALKVPVVKSTLTTEDKKIKQVDKTLFPGYVFLKTIIDDSKLEQALIERKVGHFLKRPGDEMPAKILIAEIEHIEQQEESNLDPVPEEIIDIAVGNLVEICVGPLIGFKGIVMKISGRSASIDTLIFGRSTPVAVNIAHLTKVSDNVPQ